MATFKGSYLLVLVLYGFGITRNKRKFRLSSKHQRKQSFRSRAEKRAGDKHKHIWEKTEATEKERSRGKVGKKYQMYRQKQTGAARL